jgi:pyoverdine/dityrosine biosynthesis protein Dit1/AcrR family transcriptional regulator
MSIDLLAQKLFACALDLFGQRGYPAVTFPDVAAAAGCPVDDVYRRFPRKESFVLRLYEQLAADLESRAPELPAGTVAERFCFAVRAKLAMVEPHRALFQCLLSSILDPANRLGVLGPHVDRVRARVQAVFEMVARGASDAPPPEQVGRFTRMLYGAHALLVFLLLQDQTPERRLAAEAVSLAGDFLALAGPLLARPSGGLVRRALGGLLGLPNLDQLAERADNLVTGFVLPPHDPAHFSLAENLLRDLFRHRRLQPGAGACAANPCPQCLALHLPRMASFLQANQPVQLVLPAFPAKSANLRKVTGPLPDFGEELALRFLQERCDAVRQRYPPGAKITICSDGRVFSDLVGVRDEDVTNYRVRLMELIREVGAGDLEVFDLDDVRPGDHDSTRRWLMEQHGEPLEGLVERTQQFEHHRQLFNGIHRFLTEDLAEREPTLSRTQARNRSKDQAYEVIRRSNAWGRLVSVYFPDALRLSIHPQPAHAEKIGVLLTPADDPWLTPWHGVALLQADRFVLTRRSEAEASGARLVERDGRPSHYETTPAKETSHAR